MTRSFTRILVLLVCASAAGWAARARAEQVVPPLSEEAPTSETPSPPTSTEPAPAPSAREPEPEPTADDAVSHHARERSSFRVFPSARVAFGAGWISGDAHLVIDFALGIQAFQRPGLGIGALVGFTRRGDGPEMTALTLGVPVGFVSRNARIGFGVRPDFLLGRGAGELLVGGRASAYVSYRQTLFVEGGYERLRLDGQGVDGYRVVAGVDLGIVFAGLATFGGALF